MAAEFKRQGILCVVSGPSGCGKTSLCRALSGKGRCVYAVSCTTRKARPEERDGVDYHFLSEEEFEKKEAHREFLEHAVVHGHRYGTLKETVIQHLEKGEDIVMDIDVQGAAQVRWCVDPVIKLGLMDVFMLPPSMEELRNRLEGRATETDEERQLRLRRALEEMHHWREYGHAIISGTRERDLEVLETILEGERHRASRMTPPEGADYLEPQD